ncbi:MAG: alpha/beta hydrolase [Pseudomonadota bacterium]
MQEHVITVDGANLHVFERGRPGGQQALLVHATGFHARCWDRVIDNLPATWQTFAIDMRGHGRSDNAPPYVWGRFADDLAEIVRQLDISAAIGVGHSMGGHCVAHLCARYPEVFTRLLLIDPVIFPKARYEAADPPSYGRIEDHPVARRRSHFADWQEMHSRYASRHPYSLWAPEVFEDYCRYGVVDNPDGGVDLACPGTVEAQIYMNNFSTDIYPLLSGIDQPTVILRAPGKDQDNPEVDFSASPTPPELVDEFANGEDVYLEDLTHFIPMQAPRLVADYIVAHGSSVA